jgi:hypothetical protein
MEDRFMDWSTRWRCLKCGHIPDSASEQSSVEDLKKISFLDRFFPESSEPNYRDEEVHFGTESFGAQLTSPSPPIIIYPNSAPRRNSKLR